MVEIVHLSITVSSAAQNFDASSCWDCRSISLKFCHDVAHNPNAFKSLQPLLRLLDCSRYNVSCRVAQWMSSRVTLISPVYRVTINLGSQAASWHSLPSFLQDYPPYLVASMTAWNDVVVPISSVLFSLSVDGWNGMCPILARCGCRSRHCLCTASGVRLRSPIQEGEVMEVDRVFWD